MKCIFGAIIQVDVEVAITAREFNNFPTTGGKEADLKSALNGDCITVLYFTKEYSR